MSIADKLNTIAENQVAVFDAGADSEREAFWNAYTKNGTRTNYNYGFYSTGWDDVSFRPTRNIVINTANSTFRGCAVTDMVAILNECGVTLDFSKCTVFTSTFYGMTTTTLPVIDTSSCGALTTIFASMANLVSIEKLILKSNGATTFSSIFQSTPNLEEIRIEGAIGNNGFSVSPCTKLSHDSLMSIIDHLKDYAGSGSTYTLTLGTTNLGKLTADEKKIATDKGWTLT